MPLFLRAGDKGLLAFFEREVRIEDLNILVKTHGDKMLIEIVEVLAQNNWSITRILELVQIDASISYALSHNEHVINWKKRNLRTNPGLFVPRHVPRLE